MCPRWYNLVGNTHLTRVPRIFHQLVRRTTTLLTHIYIYIIYVSPSSWSRYLYILHSLLCTTCIIYFSLKGSLYSQCRIDSRVAAHYDNIINCYKLYNIPHRFRNHLQWRFLFSAGTSTRIRYILRCIRYRNPRNRKSVFVPNKVHLFYLRTQCICDRSWLRWRLSPKNIRFWRCKV